MSEAVCVFLVKFIGAVFCGLLVGELFVELAKPKEKRWK